MIAVMPTAVSTIDADSRELVDHLGPTQLGITTLADWTHLPATHPPHDSAAPLIAELTVPRVGPAVGAEHVAAR
jgi:hypothetical protein